MRPGACISYEAERGCGYRKLGGMYLVADSMAADCGGLPIELGSCPTCSVGIRPARGWTWINPRRLFGSVQCDSFELETHSGLVCERCPVSHPPDRAGLLWIGQEHYPTPLDFTKEAAEVGVSRRISSVPHDFEIGKTWVFVAHREAILTQPQRYGVRRVDCGEWLSTHGTITEADSALARHRAEQDCACIVQMIPALYAPAIFHCFRPRAIELVVPESVTDAQIKTAEKRGLTPVIVRRAEEKPELPADGAFAEGEAL